VALWHEWSELPTIAKDAKQNIPQKKKQRSEHVKLLSVENQLATRHGVGHTNKLRNKSREQNI